MSYYSPGGGGGYYGGGGHYGTDFSRPLIQDLFPANMSKNVALDAVITFRVTDYGGSKLDLSGLCVKIEIGQNPQEYAWYNGYPNGYAATGWLKTTVDVTADPETGDMENPSVAIVVVKKDTPFQHNETIKVTLEARDNSYNQTINTFTFTTRPDPVYTASVSDPEEPTVFEMEYSTFGIESQELPVVQFVNKASRILVPNPPENITEEQHRLLVGRRLLQLLGRTATEEIANYFLEDSVYVGNRFPAGSVSLQTLLEKLPEVRNTSRSLALFLARRQDLVSSPLLQMVLNTSRRGSLGEIATMCGLFALCTRM